MWLYWPETRGMTLEEMDVIFDGEKHFDHGLAGNLIVRGLELKEA